MMSQMEARAKQLQNKVQSLCEGQFELRSNKWGTPEELSEILQGKTRIDYLGLMILENNLGEVTFLSSLSRLMEALNEPNNQKTLMIAGPARYLGIDSDGAGLKLFDLTGFPPS